MVDLRLFMSLPKQFQRELTCVLNTAGTGSVPARCRMDEKDAAIFMYHLNRHIELDRNTHGSAAWKMINELAGNDPLAIAQIKSDAEEAINVRLGLWDNLAERLRK